MTTAQARRSGRCGSESETPVGPNAESPHPELAHSPIIGGLATLGFSAISKNSCRSNSWTCSISWACISDNIRASMTGDQVGGGKGSLEINRIPTSGSSAHTARRPDTPGAAAEATPGPEGTQDPTAVPKTSNIAATNATPGHHLLNEGDDDDPAVIPNRVPRSLALRLYVSHFLSTWNSRLFEFGAALFLTFIYPGTLLPVSIYSLVRNAGYIIFAQPVGNWINKGNRLNLIRASIIGQRVPVAASCALLLVLLLKKDELGTRKNAGVFAVIVFLSVVEKLSATMNLISVERDWVCGVPTYHAFSLVLTYVKRSLLSPRTMRWPVAVSPPHHL